jgi:hypothetical protein
MTKQTFGQQAVRLTNQSNSNPLIQELKQTVAELIDQVYDIKQQSSDLEVRKFCSKAITDFETGVAWAEKAVTFNVLQQNGGEEEHYQKQYGSKRQPQMS